MKNKKDRTEKFDKKAADAASKAKAKKAAVALTLAAAVMTGSLFSGPDDITGSSAQQILQPAPVVLDISTIDAQEAAEESAPEEAKKSGIRDRIRAAIMALPYWVRVVIVVPLWAIGYVFLLLGSLAKAALSPFAGVLLSALIGVASALALFGVTAKMLFPDMPWREIFSKKNVIALAVCGALLAAADIVMPHYYSGWIYVAAAVKLAAVLIVVNVLLARLGKRAEALAEKAEEGGPLAYL